MSYRGWNDQALQSVTHPAGLSTIRYNARHAFGDNRRQVAPRGPTTRRTVADGAGCPGGVAQSVISAYESGPRQPAIPTLRALIEATGRRLILTLRRGPRPLARLTGSVGRRVRRNRRALVAAAAAHGVTGLRVFGSVACGADHPDSDVDLLADLPPGMGLIGLSGLP